MIIMKSTWKVIIRIAVVVVRNEFLKEHPDLVKEFLSSMNRQRMKLIKMQMRRQKLLMTRLMRQQVNH